MEPKIRLIKNGYIDLRVFPLLRFVSLVVRQESRVCRCFNQRANMTIKNLFFIIFLSLLALFLAPILIRLVTEGKGEAKKSVDPFLNQQAWVLVRKGCVQMNEEEQKAV